MPRRDITQILTIVSVLLPFSTAAQSAVRASQRPDVAPFVGEGGWPSGDINPASDLGARLPRGVPVYIYHGLADETAPPSHAELYARAIPQAQVNRLPHRDHQLNNDLSEIAATIKSWGARR